MNKGNQLMKGYQFSKDYARLFELAKTQDVICIVKYGNHRVVSQTEYAPESDCMSVFSAGHVYIPFCNKFHFIKYCKKVNLSYLVPNASEVEELAGALRKIVDSYTPPIPVISDVFKAIEKASNLLKKHEVEG